MKRLWGSASLDATVARVTQQRLLSAVTGPRAAKGQHMALRDFELLGAAPASRSLVHTRLGPLGDHDDISDGDGDLGFDFNDLSDNDGDLGFDFNDPSDDDGDLGFDRYEDF